MNVINVMNTCTLILNTILDCLYILFKIKHWKITETLFILKHKHLYWKYFIVICVFVYFVVKCTLRINLKNCSPLFVIYINLGGKQMLLFGETSCTHYFKSKVVRRRTEADYSFLSARIGQETLQMRFYSFNEENFWAFSLFFLCDDETAEAHSDILTVCRLTSRRHFE